MGKINDKTDQPPEKLPVAEPFVANFRCCYCAKEYASHAGLGSHLIRNHAGKKIPRWDDVALTVSEDWLAEQYQAWKTLRDA